MTNSQNDEERGVIKKKLEDCLVASDQKLTELVAKNHEELRKVMQTFTNISNNLQSSSTKLSRAKKRLVECREMLTSRLEELSRLSEESRINEKVITLLNQVDELNKVPPKITELLNKEKYLDATKLLVEKQKYIDDNFESFDCLKDTRSELDGKREELFRTLKDKLFVVEDEQKKGDIVESLKMIDKTPELPDIEIASKEKTPVTTTKPYLFRFSLSSHAICFNEHYKEQIEVTKTLLSRNNQ